MYSYIIPEGKNDWYAAARAEDVEASYRDLSEVCGRIRGKSAKWAVEFLTLAADGDIPILYKRHCTNLGHRKELGGAKGRYPVKSAKAVLKTLQSAIANSRVKGLGEELVIVHAAANIKNIFPRMAPKGRRFRQNYSTARIEIIVKSKEEPKRPKKGKEAKVEAKPEVKGEAKPGASAQSEAKAGAKGEAKSAAPVSGAKAEAKPEMKAESVPEHKAEHEAKVEAKSEAKAEKPTKAKGEGKQMDRKSERSRERKGVY